MAKEKTNAAEQAAQAPATPAQDNKQQSAPAPDQSTPEKTEDKATPAAAKKPEAKVSDSLTTIGKSLLKANPALKVVYMTADGRGFYEEADAANHARTLKNKAVKAVEK